MLSNIGNSLLSINILIEMNISYCLIGFTLLFSSIYMSYLKKDNDIFVNFMNLLDEKQKIIYN